MCALGFNSQYITNFLDFFHSVLKKSQKNIYRKLTEQMIVKCWNVFKLMDPPGELSLIPC